MRTGAQKGWEGPVALDDQLGVAALDQLGPACNRSTCPAWNASNWSTWKYNADGDGDGDDDDEEVGLSSEAWRVSNEAEPKWKYPVNRLRKDANRVMFTKSPTTSNRDESIPSSWWMEHFCFIQMLPFHELNGNYLAWTKSTKIYNLWFPLEFQRVKDIC